MRVSNFEIICSIGPSYVVAGWEVSYMALTSNGTFYRAYRDGILHKSRAEVPSSQIEQDSFIGLEVSLAVEPTALYIRKKPGDRK